MLKCLNVFGRISTTNGHFFIFLNYFVFFSSFVLLLPGVNILLIFVKFIFVFLLVFCDCRVCLSGGCRRRLKHRVNNVVAESVVLPRKSVVSMSPAGESPSSSSGVRSYYSPCYYNLQSARSMPMMMYETRV